MNLGELAERLACRLEGDAGVEVVRVASLDEAGPGDVAFFANPKFAAALARTRASAVILRPDAPAPPCAALRAENPYLAYARALGFFAPDDRPAPGIHPLALVAATARIGRDASIGPFVVIGDAACVGDRTVVHANTTIGAGASIGDDCLVHSNVAIRERVTIGHRVILQNGVVLGGDGYGFVRRADGTHEKIPQTAAVVIEDDVELGANTTVDRPAIGETRIRAGTKIDNLVQIAHGVSVGRNVLLASQTGIAGSSVIEDGVIFGGQVGVGDHLTIGRGAMAVGQAGITNSVDPGTVVGGYPALEVHEWRRAAAVFRHLPELRRRVRELEAKLESLMKQGADS